MLKEATAAGLCPKTIILSGHDAFRYAQKAIRYGVADYLLKPCRSTEILQKLEKLARDEDSAPAAQRKAGTVPNREAPPTSSAGNLLVEQALLYIRQHYPEPITQPMVAEELGIMPSYLSTLFSQNLGSGFADYLNRIRVERACDYFVDTRMKTYEVAYHVGFHDEKYFSSVFKKIMGITPSEYRKSLREKE